MTDSVSTEPEENARGCQQRIHASLARIFGESEVKSEWSVRREAVDAFTNIGLYAPRLDIAVGPFNVTRENAVEDARRIVSFEQHPLIAVLKRFGSEQHEGLFYSNPNPRCLIAIEIEFYTSSKHILGAITNASMLGRVGIVLGSARSIAKIGRIGSYARTLREVGKSPEGLFTNVVFFDVDCFHQLLRVEDPNARRVGQN
jgi:hypothetical protein